MVVNYAIMSLDSPCCRDAASGVNIFFTRCNTSSPLHNYDEWNVEKVVAEKFSCILCMGRVRHNTVSVRFKGLCI